MYARLLFGFFSHQRFQRPTLRPVCLVSLLILKARLSEVLFLFECHKYGSWVMGCGLWIMGGCVMGLGFWNFDLK